ncbi:hypothetical protein U9M48_000946 [Paspalum notatum var. saurae]|uniref:Uncharacterized protein n=1 Tax=Paspalum notatum var. saurae TaxID=547442 RepID=A0AAQ3PFC8_PASNO
MQLSRPLLRVPPAHRGLCTAAVSKMEARRRSTRLAKPLVDWSGVPLGYCPVHGYGPCVLRDAGVLELLRMGAAAVATTTVPTPSPPVDDPALADMLATVVAPRLASTTPTKEDDPPCWRSPDSDPVNVNTGRPAGRRALLHRQWMSPPSVKPLPTSALLNRRRHVGETAAHRPCLHILDAGSSTNLANGYVPGLAPGSTAGLADGDSSSTDEGEGSNF